MRGLFFARVSSSLASIAAAFVAAFASIAFPFRAAASCPGELLPSRFGRLGLVLANCYRQALSRGGRFRACAYLSRGLRADLAR